jgi:hypothetical protein
MESLVENEFWILPLASRSNDTTNKIKVNDAESFLTRIFTSQ